MPANQHLALSRTDLSTITEVLAGLEKAGDDSYVELSGTLKVTCDGNDLGTIILEKGGNNIGEWMR
jgi:hypothetical protein